MAGQDKKQQDGEAEAEQAAADRKAAAAKAAKLVFSDPFSRQTSDDTDAGWGEDGAGRGLDWYLSQRPPHHGG
ncbi:hypothetical protein P3T37_003462 [Kitasatospora sp. MAA4]|uniref:hypothetical protein n=1 Tax=Kitasatospora sp. MAA4 TaxID=3035093 RepID=UPI002476492C|nr:hypothetical protein [Kitasatospora sp. MAA4]MDH6134063.1 hypothetical protein [Kitasatospora sp. MAA4]